MKDSKLWLFLAFLSALCVLDSLWLSAIQSNIEELSSYCHIGSGFDCAPALKSRYGKIFGTPLSTYAVGNYLFVFALSVQPFFAVNRRNRNSVLLFIANAFGTIFCLWLYISRWYG